MTVAWKTDKAWSDRFIPTIQAVLGQFLFCPAPDVEDAERNTDLMVFNAENKRIACRIRTHDYLARFGDEFTIRCARPSGNKTELAKIIEGWGDYIFYGFSDAEQRGLAKWTLGDLDVFRLWWQQSEKTTGTLKRNRDGSSDFQAFKLSVVPSVFVVASGEATYVQSLLERIEPPTRIITPRQERGREDVRDLWRRAIEVGIPEQQLVDAIGRHACVDVRSLTPEEPLMEIELTAMASTLRYLLGER